MMESIFTFLFKYPPLLFQEGDFVLLSPWPLLVTAAVIAVVAAVGIWTYTRTPGRATLVEKGVMVGLRLAALGVLIFCLFQPSLVLTAVVPQRNFLGILVDDSRSMNLADASGKTRADWIRETLGDENNEMVKQLAEKFSLRFFSFSRETARINSVNDITFNGTGTDLSGALIRAREELSAVPLSALVVLSDGADNAGGSLPNALVPLQASSVPVMTVGLGDEELEPDIQVDRVELPRTVLKGTSLVVDAVLTGKGLRDETVSLIVEDESKILSTQDVELSDDGEPTVTRVRFTLNDVGPKQIRFRVAPQDGERVTQNNQRTAVVDVRAATEKILYFEGEPRFEVKFLRRAVADDENLQLVVLQRTAENKYLRLDVDHPEELQAGFPTTREELFQYRSLVLGSVEASYFTHDQLVMIADFVSQRGGGLLMLGGLNAFAEGGYGGTPLEDILPVILEPPAEDPRDAFTELRVIPTPAGLNHVATQITPGQVPSQEKWDSLPPLSTLNRVVSAKPGATILLTGLDATGGQRIVLAHHRYGRGKVLALPVQDTWLWQMHYDIPLEDMTHETFWRQLLRWLVDGVPEPVAVFAEREQVEPNEPVSLRVEVSDSAYSEVNDAQVTATVTDPQGNMQLVTLDWTLERDGEYAGTFRPSTAGFHDIRVDAMRGATQLGNGALHVQVGPSDTEFFDAAQRRPLLERIAEDTGGRYYTPDNVSSLPEDLTYTGAGVTLTEERELWDMPILFFTLMGLVGAEWFFRRKRGLI
jgi:uncharacterized membrane protein